MQRGRRVGDAAADGLGDGAGVGGAFGGEGAFHLGERGQQQEGPSTTASSDDRGRGSSIRHRAAHRGGCHPCDASAVAWCAGTVTHALLEGMGCRDEIVRWTSVACDYLGFLGLAAALCCYRRLLKLTAWYAALGGRDSFEAGG